MSDLFAWLFGEYGLIRGDRMGRTEKRIFWVLFVASIIAAIAVPLLVLVR